MKRNWPLLTLFSAVYAFLILAPSTFHQEFPLKTGMEWGDALDIAPPFVVVGLVWLLVSRTVSALDGRATLVLLLIAVVWSQGQGMHLASNSIGHQVTEGEGSGLVHFFDEVLSHYIWSGAILATLAYVLLPISGSGSLSA